MDSNRIDHENMIEISMASDSMDIRTDSISMVFSYDIRMDGNSKNTSMDSNSIGMMVSNIMNISYDISMDSNALRCDLHALLSHFSYSFHF